MPCIQLSTNQEITREKETNLKRKFGKSIELVPGKTERWLMVSLQGGCRMYFAGDDQKPIAFVKVGLFGKAPQTAYDKLTSALTDIISLELEVEPTRIYIQYEESQFWGWNGGNF